jgi:hypothetical protein
MADKYADRITGELVSYVEEFGGIASTEVYHRGFRSDVLLFSEDDLFIDFEVKTTVSDFWNDFSKTNKRRENRHHLFEQGFLSNKFYFVFPPNLIPLEKVPEDYGIIHYIGDGQFKRIRAAAEFDISENYDEMFNSFVLHLCKKEEYCYLRERYDIKIDLLEYQNEQYDVEIHNLKYELSSIKAEYEKIKREFDCLQIAVEERYGYIDY